MKNVPLSRRDALFGDGLPPFREEEEAESGWRPEPDAERSEGFEAHPES